MAALTKNDADEVCELDGSPFTLYYGQLQHQQNMLQDSIRTGMYQYAFTQNTEDFSGATVLDVGTGTGLLAFFSAQAGAKKVYAVEHAESMADMAKLLVKGNHLEHVIEVITSSLEKTELKEKVDIIVSEPIGFLLVHERMLESFITARDMYLKKDGLMMPSSSDIIVTPFTDEVLFNEQNNKSLFWENKEFYGIDLSSLNHKAKNEYMSQAVVGYFSSDILISCDHIKHVIDFRTISLKEIQSFEIPVHFRITKTSILHGLACWFDAHFLGTTCHVTLTTAPDQPGTHWYQCRLLLKEPIAVNASQTVSGNMKFVASSKISYMIEITLKLDGTHITSTNTINLQDQMYHYLQSTAAATPGGSSTADQTAGYGY